MPRSTAEFVALEGQRFALDRTRAARVHMAFAQSLFRPALTAKQESIVERVRLQHGRAVADGSRVGREIAAGNSATR